MKTVALLYTRSAASDVTTPGFDLNDLIRYAIAVDFTGANVVGTLKLQASVDGASWFDVTGSSQSVTSSQGHIWDVTVCGYRWVRVDWDYTSGTGNITIDLHVKENVVRFP